jgi:hypothetical protein
LLELLSELRTLKEQVAVQVVVQAAELVAEPVQALAAVAPGLVLVALLVVLQVVRDLRVPPVLLAERAPVVGRRIARQRGAPDHADKLAPARKGRRFTQARLVAGCMSAAGEGTPEN